MFASSIKPEENKKQLPHPLIPLLFDNIGSENQYKCGHCQVSFILQEDLISHLTAGNPEIKFEKTREDLSYTCTICSIDFTTFKGIMQHYGKIHLTAKDYPCNICGKLFKDKYAVGYHLRNVHDDRTKVKCENCSKVCYNKYTHKTHHQKCLLKNPANKNKS